MALTATIYNLSTDLSDIDRGVYDHFDLRVALQPSETPEYMVSRVLAYCLEYTEGIELTQGVAAEKEPAVVVRDMTGRMTAWIEVGMPDADRIHRGVKLAGRAAIYTHRDINQVMRQFAEKRIHRGDEIPVYFFGRGFIESVAAALDRRSELSLSVTERELYLDLNGQSFTTTIEERRAG